MQPSHSLKPRADVFNEEPLDHHRAHTVALARAVVRKPRRPVAIRRPDLYPWPAHHPRGHAAARADPAPKRSTRAPSYANLGIHSHPNAQTSSPFGNASPGSVSVASAPSSRVRACACRSGSQSIPDTIALKKSMSCVRSARAVVRRPRRPVALRHPDLYPGERTHRHPDRYP